MFLVQTTGLWKLGEARQLFPPASFPSQSLPKTALAKVISVALSQGQGCSMLTIMIDAVDQTHPNLGMVIGH